MTRQRWVSGWSRTCGHRGVDKNGHYLVEARSLVLVMLVRPYSLIARLKGGCSGGGTEPKISKFSENQQIKIDPASLQPYGALSGPASNSSFSPLRRVRDPRSSPVVWIAAGLDNIWPCSCSNTQSMMSTRLAVISLCTIEDRVRIVTHSTGSITPIPSVVR